MQLIDACPCDLAEVLRILAEYVPDREVRVFGSREQELSDGGHGFSPPVLASRGGDEAAGGGGLLTSPS